MEKAVPMLILPGSPALSAFRKEKLLEALPNVAALSARYVHFVELEAGLDEREQRVLESLLEYGPTLDETPVDGDLYVVVRLRGARFSVRVHIFLPISDQHLFKVHRVYRNFCNIH